MKAGQAVGTTTPEKATHSKQSECRAVHRPNSKAERCTGAIGPGPAMAGKSGRGSDHAALVFDVNRGRSSLRSTPEASGAGKPETTAAVVAV